MTYAYKNILLIFDFTDKSTNALKTAIAMSKRQNAALHLLYTFHPYVIGSEAGIRGLYTDIHHSCLQDVSDTLNAYQHEISSQYDFPVYAATEIGGMKDTISRYVDNNQIDIILSGISDDRMWAGYRKSRYMKELLQSSKCPVLFIPDFSPVTSFQSIVMPYYNKAGFNQVRDICDPIIRANQSELYPVTCKSEKKHQPSISYSHDNNLAGLILTQEPHFKIKNSYKVSHHPESVIKLACELNADLIALGIPQKAKSKRLIQSDLMMQVARQCPIPFICFKQPAGNEGNIQKITVLNSLLAQWPQFHFPSK